MVDISVCVQHKCKMYKNCARAIERWAGRLDRNFQSHICPAKDEHNEWGCAAYLPLRSEEDT